MRRGCWDLLGSIFVSLVVSFELLEMKEDLLDEVDHQSGVVAVESVDGVRELEYHLVVLDVDRLVCYCVCDADRESHGTHPASVSTP